MKLIDIAELARRSGVPASALRYYEEKGLIQSVGRFGLRRTFAPATLQQLSLIALAQAGGFSLQEIGEMFAPCGTPRIDRAQLEAKAEEIERTISRLTATQTALRHVAACPASNHFECPSFSRMLRLAARGRAQPRANRTKPLRHRMGDSRNR
ncbi:MAG TPA: helix-turn-helix domain-containing protein [Sphingopyxis sp.]|nr:helix-turn-helix domain-containing protein [Sphingopyxis sp.]